MPEEAKGKTFELGLVMAGAISAGAYTAGVMDFLIEALDEWESAKSSPSNAVPRHDVALRVISGASAGAMTSAISAVALTSEIDHVDDPDSPPPPDRNRLYDAWVRQIDITKLLTTSDIDSSGKVVSLLNAAPLHQIASAALIAPRRQARRSYAIDPLAVMLSVANLRGVPYGFHLLGEDTASGYGMYEHMDHMQFALSWSGQQLPGARLLDPAERPMGEWPNLLAAALASGAFPGGLAPQLLERPRNDYSTRHTCPPLWDACGAAYGFLCVDGGLMNNEPLELARLYLSDGPETPNPRSGTKAHRAVVLIDPFPNTAALTESYQSDDRLLAVVLQMFSALKNQARFKPAELELAARPDVFSRFMIAPSRQDDARNPIEPAIASGVMDGFGGFFHESFRRHDFQLGRRNCQAFLKWRFCLPENNPVVSIEDASVRNRFYVQESDGRY
ncbi:MAG: hypothetical protein AB7F89_19605, partial [Pirellulaceae bacterium]